MHSDPIYPLGAINWHDCVTQTSRRARPSSPLGDTCTHPTITWAIGKLNCFSQTRRVSVAEWSRVRNAQKAPNSRVNKRTNAQLGQIRNNRLKLSSRVMTADMLMMLTKSRVVSWRRVVTPVTFLGHPPVGLTGCGSAKSQVEDVSRIWRWIGITPKTAAFWSPTEKGVCVTSRVCGCF